MQARGAARCAVAAQRTGSSQQVAEQLRWLLLKKQQGRPESLREALRSARRAALLHPPRSAWYGTDSTTHGLKTALNDCAVRMHVASAADEPCSDQCAGQGAVLGAQRAKEQHLCSESSGWDPVGRQLLFEGSTPRFAAHAKQERSRAQQPNRCR
jgi:hypothetical protein